MQLHYLILDSIYVCKYEYKIRIRKRIKIVTRLETWIRGERRIDKREKVREVGIGGDMIALTRVKNQTTHMDTSIILELAKHILHRHQTVYSQQAIQNVMKR